jgi:hypothetical protein
VCSQRIDCESESAGGVSVGVENKKLKMEHKALLHKPLANMYFNQHSGRRGTRSATSTADKILRKQASEFGGIRPGPRGMGMINPMKPSQIPSGHEAAEKKTFSHLHQIHEKYNER